MNHSDDLERSVKGDTRSTSGGSEFDTVDFINKEHPEFIDRFKLVQVLGKGGFGTVYLAHDGTLDRSVAIKVPHKQLILNEETIANYHAEARAVASLEHPSIVPVFDVGQTEKHPVFIVYKYIAGASLASYLVKNDFSHERSAEIIASIADALHFAHQKGFIHRDVKPSNILLDKNDEPFLVDFGLALDKTIAGNTGSYAGTPAFMSPEQVVGKAEELDARSDVYSLSTVLYVMLTGRRPFSATSREELLELICNGEVLPPRKVRSSIPITLEDICLKGLQKRRKDRFTSAFEMGVALREFVHYRGELDTHRHSNVAGYYFSGQQETIRSKTTEMVERDYVGGSFLEFQSSNSRGYFVIEATAGEGKTTVCCRLASQLECAHHFVNTSGGRDNIELIIKSLLDQLGYIWNDDIANQAPATLPELSKAFEDCVRASANSVDSIVILIDALDELGSSFGRMPPFLLTDSLPHNVYYVVSCRRGEFFQRLLAGLHSIPHITYSLSPFTMQETSEYLATKGVDDLDDASIRRVYERSGGHPIHVHAIAEEFRVNNVLDMTHLPHSMGDYYRRLFLDVADPFLRDVLGVLCVSRQPLTVRNVSAIASIAEREIHGSVTLAQHCLTQFGNTYAPYHASLREFVVQELLFDDEVTHYNRLIADWLMRPENEGSEQYWSDLAYHLYHSRDLATLRTTVSEAFLAEKARRFHYAVLDDVDFLTLALLGSGDAQAVRACVDTVTTLCNQIGGEHLVSETVGRVHGGNSLAASHFTDVLEAGWETFSVMIPKGNYGADFVEIIPCEQSVLTIVGDMPGSSLMSSFSARFLKLLVRNLGLRGEYSGLHDLMETILVRIEECDFFEAFSMQCLECCNNGIVTFANAGHVFPVLYSSQLGKAERLPLLGEIISSEFTCSLEQLDFRRAETAVGDVLVLLSDGLTEGFDLSGSGYGYRFQKVIEANAMKPARKIGEAILDDWRNHPREHDHRDDVSLIVLRRVGDAELKG